MPRSKKPRKPYRPRDWDAEARKMREQAKAEQATSAEPNSHSAGMGNAGGDQDDATGPEDVASAAP